MLRGKRRWEGILEDDPATGIINLVDVWIVFAFSLMLALVSYYNLTELVTQSSEVTLIKDPGGKNMEIIKKTGIKVERYRATTQKLGGEGEKLGTAYRLKSGEVVYVPEDAKTP